MDKLNNVGAVQAALGNFKTAADNLKTTEESLNRNKGEISSSWESGNASDFILQYNSLINNLSEAFAGLAGYQQKIDAVVQEFIGFDNTIN